MSAASRARQRQRESANTVHTYSILPGLEKLQRLGVVQLWHTESGGHAVDLTENGLILARKAKQSFVALFGREPCDSKNWVTALEMQPECAEWGALVAVLAPLINLIDGTAPTSERE